MIFNPGARVMSVCLYYDVCGMVGVSEIVACFFYHKKVFFVGFLLLCGFSFQK